MTAKREPELRRGDKLQIANSGGVSLRDRFAIAALPAIVSSISTTLPAKLDEEAQKIGFAGSYQQFAARIAYDYADAMIDESERRKRGV